MAQNTNRSTIVVPTRRHQPESTCPVNASRLIPKEAVGCVAPQFSQVTRFVTDPQLAQYIYPFSHFAQHVKTMTNEASGGGDFGSYRSRLRRFTVEIEIGVG